MIRLTDIAGYEREKEEVLKIIKLLTNYKKYSDAGAYIPKGLILQGPPGCGKTLLATAIAGEAGVPFFNFKISTNAETNIANLDSLLKQAKASTPAILYIDEIDKLTSPRYNSSDAVRNIVQYLLTEIDGLQSSQGVLIIASTNVYDDLPESLVRSGRMDKKISISRPNLDSRTAILAHYINQHEIFKEVNIKTLALKTKGMSGADIKTLVNNALIEYLDLNQPVVVDHFTELINQMNFEDIGRQGTDRKSVIKVLIHEAGHAIINYCLTNSYSAISGVRHGDAAGFTEYLDDYNYPVLVDEDEITVDDLDQTADKQDLLVAIARSFGGMVAEDIFYGSHGLGCESDIDNALNDFKFLANNYFLDSRFLGLSVDRTSAQRIVYKYLSVRDKVFKKQIRLCRQLIKQNKYLISYIVDEALAHEDVLNATQLHDCIEYYETHKKELKKKYKKHPIITTSSFNPED